MPPALNHYTRLERCLAGEDVDRIPIALWRHFPVDDQHPERLAKAIVQFQSTYDFDFIKVTPASSYCLRDWGITDQWEGDPEGTRTYLHHPVAHPEDWLKLPPLNPYQGALGDMLSTLRTLKHRFAGQVPILQTIFSPLAQAKNLAGEERLILHLRTAPDALHAGLQRITESTLAFVGALKELGIDGIFYAVQHARFDVLSPLEFSEFGRAYDLKILDAARDFWLNVGHIHGEHIMFSLIQDYPVQILNWHDRQTTPTLREALTRVSGAVCGGLSQWSTMALGNPEDVQREARQAIQETQGKRFILGTGCVLPIITPHGNILAACQATNLV
ncbi:uroporphyrinogen decarboxylase family protein [Thermanaerothrix sp.]|uniref:uroporphyrinogen decarboxylase family protein n=1 Tax=Thermanaerothrix sp. TaxID=2972675 RepID=UPI003C7B9793